jgi:hypothetical protein
MEKEKRSAHILYIPTHLSKEVSDFPLLYQEEKMAKFKGFVRQENAIGFDASISDDGLVATITFNNLELSVGGKNSTSVATQVATFTLPIIENATDLHVQLSIQGYVITEPGTRAILVAHLGDTTELASFALSSNQSFLQVVEATLPAGVDVQPTLFLLAERNSGDENLGAYLNVATLDFTLGELESGEP